MNLGVISDTHNFLDPAVLDLLQGVDHILHGGDIGQPRILRDLEQIAPVTAVAGNTDDPGLRYPLFASATLGRWKFLLHHIVNPNRLTGDLEGRIAHDCPDVVIFGHTHQAFSESCRDVLFFNPGYAGKPRFRLQRSIGFISDEGGSLRTRILLLNS